MLNALLDRFRTNDRGPPPMPDREVTSPIYGLDARLPDAELGRRRNAEHAFLATMPRTGCRPVRPARLAADP